MNVAFDQWIPVVTLDGKPKRVSLIEIFSQGHSLADLAVKPHERVALMRLFVCVAHAALDGPKDYEDWLDVPLRLSDAGEKYLHKWKESFELFHPTKPWLQVTNLDSGKPGEEGWGPVSKLGFFLASGANSTLFDHDGMNNDHRDIDLSSTILSLISFQCFSPGGLISQVMWNGIQTSKSSKDGPCVTASMVHALIRSESIAMSIRSNLPTFESVGLAYGGRPIGRPVWESMVLTSGDRESIDNATSTYMGRLVPMTRVIKLHNSGKKMLLGEGLPYPSFSDGFPAEPTAIVIVKTKEKKQERVLLSYRPGRAFWRELGAIITRRNAEGVGGPLSMLSLEEGDACDLIVCALARDQASILDTAESVYHIPSILLSQDGRRTYEAEVNKSEDFARRLGWAIEDYRRTLDGGWEGRLKSAGQSKGDLLNRLHGNASILYWTKVEKRIGLLMAHVQALGSDTAESTREEWRAMLWQSTREAYQSVCGQDTPRQMKAFTEGWKKLHFKYKDDSDNNNRKEQKYE